MIDQDGMNDFYPNTLALLISALLSVALMTGCGIFRTGDRVYTESQEIDPIRVPEGLSEPPIRSTFDIPGYSLPELAAQGDEAQPPRVLPSAEAERARSRIRFGPTGLYLEVDDEADSVWRRLGFALNRAGMSVTEVSENQRRYRFDFSHDPIEHERGLFRRTVLFWRSPEVTDYSGEYLIEVQPETDERTRVAILDTRGDVIRMERAEYVLAQLRERLG